MSQLPPETPAPDAAQLNADLAAVARIEAVPKILDVVCRTTGLGFAAVARVTESRWIAAAVRDEIHFGLTPGGELPVETTICHEIRQAGQPVVIDHVATDAAYCSHPTPQRYGFQSYISVPIVLPDGRFFGTLCAIGPKPARLNTPETLNTFRLFADLIAAHLDADRRMDALADAAASAQRAENDAAERLSRLRSVIESVKDYAVISLDVDGRIVGWNAGATDTFGHAEARAIGADAAALFTADDRAVGVPRQELARARESGLAEDNRWMLRADGRRIFVVGVVRTVRDANGALAGFVKVCRDETGRQALRQQLDDARRRVDSALAAGSVGTFHWNLAEDRVFGDANFARMFGVRLDESGRLPIADYLAAIHPDDRPGTVDRIERSVATGDPYLAEYRIVTDTGESRDIVARGRIERDDAGRAVRFAGVIVDVTDRKRTERQLRSTEHRYRQLFESIDQGFCVIEVLFGDDGQAVDYRYVEANPAFERQTGLRDVIGRRVREMAPDLDPVWARTYGRVALTGESVRFESPVAFAGRWFDIHASRAGAPDERRVAIVFDDVTERRQMVVALRDSEARFRQLADAMPQIVFAAQPDGHVDYFNRRWYEYTGLPEGSIGFDNWRHVHTDEGLRRVGQVWPAALAAGTPYEIEYPLRRADGQYRWHLGRALPVKDERGVVVRWFGTNTDVHDQRMVAEALREGRQQLSVAVEAGRLGTWQVDLASLVMTCSDTCKSNYGRPLDRPFTYAELWECVHTEDVPAAQAAVRRAIEERIDYAAEYRVIWPDGSVHWAAVRGRVTYADDGAPIRISGVSQDVTDRKHAEADRERLLTAERAARVESEQAGRMKDEFLATLSHELRTPLNAIVGWTQILRLGEVDPTELAEGLSVIDRNARAQTQIIEDILDMSRIVSGKLRLDVRRVDPAALVHAGIDTVQPAADAKGVRIQAVLDPTAGPVSGDPDRLHQVFWNLLANAVKFTPKGGRVQVRLARVDSHVEVTVADTGEGIEPAFLPHVFERFRQADASTTRRHGGLGLGLSIVKQLIELHGGTVRANSAGQGRGATFTVELPLMLAPMAGVDESTKAEPLPTPAARVGEVVPGRPLAGITVVAADDEPDGRAIIKRLLEDRGATVWTAGSAAEALELVGTHRPTILVSDIGMPGEDGYALIRRVRALPLDAARDIPAIALTAYARPADRVRALEAGFQMHLAKPVDPAELVATIVALARLTQARV